MPPNPQIIAETAKMELQGHETEAKIATERARQVDLYAGAMLKLAQTDVTNGELPLAWTAQQLEIVRMRMEATNGKAAGGGGQMPKPRLPAPSQGMPSPATDDGMPPEMMDLAGMAPEEDDTNAPIPGAKQAPDGQWYVDDANRPGKFMRVSA